MAGIIPNRRDFLKFLLAAPIATTFDVEKLLWVKDKTIFIPNSINDFDIISLELERILHLLPTIFEKESTLSRFIKES